MKTNEKYTREQLKSSKKYENKKDLITGLLKEELEYSQENVEKIILSYKERRI